MKKKVMTQTLEFEYSRRGGEESEVEAFPFQSVNEKKGKKETPKNKTSGKDEGINEGKVRQLMILFHHYHHLRHPVHF